MPRRIYHVENNHIGWHENNRLAGMVLYGPINQMASISVKYLERNVHRKRYSHADAQAVVEWLNTRALNYATLRQIPS